MPAWPGFINGSYQSQSPLADSERTLNFIVEVMESAGATTKAALYPTPGFQLFGATPEETPVRGIWEGDGRMLVAVGGTLQERTADGGTLMRGSIDNDSLPVTFHWNGPSGGQVFFTSAGTGYIFTLSTNVLTSVVDDAYFSGYLDGFFLSLDTTLSRLKISNLFAGQTWDPIKYGQRTVAADTWVSMWVNNREIWLFGTLTTEVWYNRGDPIFPFVPIERAFLEEGIAAPRSVATVAGATTWLGRNKNGAGVVRRAEGWRGIRISDHALETAIQSYSRIDDAIGWTYESDGHEFYVLEFPAADKTWVYDAVTQLWCERSSYDAARGADTAWRARWHVYGYGKHLVGDRLSGGLYEMSRLLAFDIGGGIIRRVRRAPYLNTELNGAIIRSLRLDLETGIGLSTGQGDDPTVMMHYTNDGRTFGPELWRSAGRIGQYKAIVEWNRLGQLDRPMFEVMFSDPVPWRILNAYVEA